MFREIHISRPPWRARNPRCGNEHHSTRDESRMSRALHWIPPRLSAIDSSELEKKHERCLSGGCRGEAAAEAVVNPHRAFMGFSTSKNSVDRPF